MKTIDEYLHYRLVDVSSVKELVGYWYPDVKRPAVKVSAHRAMDDILESIEELRFYKEKFFKSLPLT
jgi:oligoribonuclease